MLCCKCHQTVPDGPYCCQCGAKQSTQPERKVSHRVRGNGTGTAFKRGRSWTAQITVWKYEKDADGVNRKVRHRVSKGGFKTKKEALQYLATMTESTERKAPKMIELWERYETHDLAKLGASKQTAYQIARKRLDAIMDSRIDDLTTADLQRVIDDNATSYYTARDMKSVLSHLYQLAIPDGYVTGNLSQYVSLPSLEEKEPEPFSPAEVSKIWTAYADGDIFAAYMILMIYSGMMPGELCACKKSMIDFDRCEIWGCGKKTKTRKETPIVFADCAKPALVELCESVDGDLLQPKHRTDWYDDYHAFTARIGIRDLPPYACRHTTGTEAAKQNLNAATIQKIMRHAKIATSQRYIHLGNDAAHAGLNTLLADVR